MAADNNINLEKEKWENRQKQGETLTLFYHRDAQRRYAFHREGILGLRH